MHDLRKYTTTPDGTVTVSHIPAPGEYGPEPTADEDPRTNDDLPEPSDA